MPDETMQLLKAYIDATGYEIEIGYTLTKPTSEVYKVTKKKPKPRAPAKDTGYSRDFDILWSKYPKGHGGSKIATFKKYNQRLDEANNPFDEYDAMSKGLDNYIPYLKSVGYSVKSSETFFGINRHYLNDYTIPDSAKQKNKIKVPRDDGELEFFARENSLRMPRVGETSIGYRKSLQQQVDNLELSAN